MLNQQQQQYAKDIFHAGLLRAANALGVMIQKAVSFKTTALHIAEQIHNTAQLPPLKGQQHVLFTSLMGQLWGHSYLLINQADALQLQQLTLPQYQTKVADVEFLKEIDNILAAAVISELSNRLARTVYGGVPEHHFVPAHNMQQWIAQQHNSKNKPQPGYYLTMTSSLHVNDQATLTFYFVWHFTDDTLQQIKKASEQQEA